MSAALDVAETIGRLPIQEIRRKIKERSDQEIEIDGLSIADQAWLTFSEQHVQALIKISRTAANFLSQHLQGIASAYEIVNVLSHFTYAFHIALTTAGHNAKALSKRFNLSPNEQIDLASIAAQYDEVSTIFQDILRKLDQGQLKEINSLVAYLLPKLAQMYAAKHITDQLLPNPNSTPSLQN